MVESRLLVYPAMKNIQTNFRFSTLLRFFLLRRHMGHTDGQAKRAM